MRLLLLLPLNPFLLRLDELALAQLPVDLDVATIVGLTLESADPDRRADVSLIRRSVQDDGQRRGTTPFDLVDNAAEFFSS